MSNIKFSKTKKENDGIRSYKLIDKKESKHKRMLEVLLRHLCIFRDGSAHEKKDYE